MTTKVTYNLVPPTIVSGNATNAQCDVNGNLKTNLATLISGEDQTLDTITVLDYNQREINLGEYFTWADDDTDVDIAAPKYWRITTPNSVVRIHIFIVLYASEGGLLEIYENPTLNAAGTAGTPINNDRNSATAATSTVFYDTTTTSDGTRVWCGRLGSIGGKIIFPAPDRKFILKQTEDYIVKFTSDVDNTKTTINMSWFEYTP